MQLFLLDASLILLVRFGRSHVCGGWDADKSRRHKTPERRYRGAADRHVISTLLSRTLSSTPRKALDKATVMLSRCLARVSQVALLLFTGAAKGKCQCGSCKDEEINVA